MHIHFHDLLAHYGLAALAFGAGLEGETVVVGGGILARKGTFSLPGAMAAASAGSFVADQLWFHVGRWFRHRRFVARMRAKPAFKRALDFVEKHPIGFIFAFRFIYGLRTVSPIAIGTTTVPTRTFVIVNFLAAIVWGCAFTALGYAAGKAVEHWLHDWLPGWPTLLAIAGGVALVALGTRLWLRRRANQGRRSGQASTSSGRTEVDASP